MPNLLINSGDYTATGWTVLGGVTISGTALTDPSTSASADRIGQAVAVVDDSAPHVFSAEILKTSADAHYAALLISFSGGTIIDRRVIVNTNTGVISATFGTPTNSGSEDRGTHWKVFVAQENNGTGNTSVTCGLWPAYNTTGTAGVDHTSTGVKDMRYPLFHPGTTPNNYVETRGDPITGYRRVFRRGRLKTAKRIA